MYFWENWNAVRKKLQLIKSCTVIASKITWWQNFLVSDLLSYQRKAIKKPITNTQSKIVIKECSGKCFQWEFPDFWTNWHLDVHWITHSKDCFKLISGYMTDFDRESENRCSLAKNIIKRGWTDVDFANEIYAIIIKQVKY